MVSSRTTDKQSTQQALNNERLHKKQVSKKESFRWVLSYRHATEIAKQCPETQVINIADREGDLYDIYEEFRQTEGPKADWLVRMKIINRAIMNGMDK